MPKTRFYLKAEPNRDSLHLVLLKYYAPPRQLTLSTGIQVEQKDWNTNQQRVRKTDPTAADKNRVLDNWSLDIEKAVLSLKANKRPVTVESIRAALEKDPARQKAADIVAFTRSHFADKKGASVYNNLAAQVERFTRSTRRGRTFEELTPVWFSEFREHLKGQNLSDIYTARILVALKTAVRQAAVNGITQNTAVLIAPIEVEATAASAVILTLEEVKAFADHTIANASLANVRDCFVCACLTGLRHSDWNKLTTDPETLVKVHSREYCRVIMQKTGVGVHVPLFDVVKKILLRHGGKLPVISDQKTNAYLKEAARLAGFTDSVTKYSSRGTKQQTETLARCDMMSTHTARRTFNSACRAVSMPDNLIAEMTGHSKKRNMADLYDRRSFEQKADQLEPYLQKMEMIFPRDYEIRFM